MMTDILKRSFRTSLIGILSFALLLGFALIPANAFAQDYSIHVSTFEELDNTLFGLNGVGKTVVLDKDIVMGEHDTLYPCDGNLILNLNGHKITKQLPANGDGNIFFIDSEKMPSNVTITGNGTIKYTSEGHQGVIFTCMENCKLTIENGTFEGFQVIYNSGTAVINGGSFTAETIITNDGDNAKVTVNKGTFLARNFKDGTYDDPFFSKNQTCFHCDSGAKGIVINGGTFDCGDSVCGVFYCGNVKVTGGVFKGNCAAFFSDVGDTASLTITGGDFTGCDSFFAFYDDELAVESKRLYVSDAAKLTTKQRNQVNMTVLRGNKQQAAENARKAAVPAKAQIAKVTSQKKGFKLTLVKTKNAKQYQISYRMKKGKKWKQWNVKTVPASKTTVKVKKLKSKKKYQIRVRAINKYNGETLYGAWSAVKTVKTK